MGSVSANNRASAHGPSGASWRVTYTRHPKQKNDLETHNESRRRRTSNQSSSQQNRPDAALAAVGVPPPLLVEGLLNVAISSSRKRHDYGFSIVEVGAQHPDMVAHTMVYPKDSTCRKL